MTLLLFLIASLFLSPIAQETEPSCKSQIAIFPITRRGVEFYLMDGDTFEVAQLSPEMEETLVEVVTLRWSPDGSKLLFTAKAEGADNAEYGLYLLEAGEMTRIAQGPIFAPQWSPSGSFIAYNHLARDTQEIRVIRLDTLEIETIAEVAEYSFGWATDNALYLFSDKQGEVFTVDLSASERALEPVTIPGFDEPINDILPSLDGQTLAVISDDDFTVFLFDTETEELTETEAITPSIEWSPDSTRFTFIDNKEIYLVTLDGEISNLSESEDLSGTLVFSAGWSADGEWILMMVGNTTNEGFVLKLYVVNVNSTDILEIASNSNFLAAAWSPCIEGE